jgi:hypothetical protein
VLPLILTLPLMIPTIPLNMKTSIFTLIIVFISVFGTAVSLIQLKESKMIERIAVLPLTSTKFTFNYLFANLVMDCMKMGIPLTLLLIMNLSAFQILSFSWVLINFIISILFANCLGIIVAIGANSSGEGHLYSIIMVLGISSISGIFFFPMPDFLNLISLFIPFKYFSNSLALFWNGFFSFSIIPIITLIVIVGITILISLKLFRFK